MPLSYGNCKEEAIAMEKEILEIVDGKIQQNPTLSITFVLELEKTCIGLMKLKYQEQIDAIGDCPSININGQLELFRCVSNPIDDDSFLPQAVLLKPKHQDNCLAWGLSCFSSESSAKGTLANLSKRKRSNYSIIAKGMITDEDGIKHRSGANKQHFTLYPIEGLDLSKRFKVVENQ